MKTVMFRTDIHKDLGTGHIMRCIRLARWLTENQCNVHFVCNVSSMKDLDIVKKQGFQADALFSGSFSSFNQLSDAEDMKKILCALPKKPDYLIIDSYLIDACWESHMKNYVKEIIVIDDLANRPHFCHILLDHNPLPEQGEKYINLIPDFCQKWLGKNYLLIDPKWITNKQSRIRKQIKRINVFFGGVDKTNETEKVIRAFANESDVILDIVITSLNPHKDKLLKTFNKHPNINIYISPEDFSEIVKCADLCIGAGGTHTWERICQGKPAITLCIADNQREILKYCHNKQLLIHLGEASEVSEVSILNVWKQLKANLLQYEQIVEKCHAFFSDISTSLHPLVSYIITPKKYELREIHESDRDLLYFWRNQPFIRSKMFHSDKISKKDHDEWFNKQVKSLVKPMIFSVNSHPYGFLQYYSTKENQVIKWGFYIGEKKSIPGHGRKMGWMAITYAFEVLKGKILIGEVKNNNITSKKFHLFFSFLAENQKLEEENPKEFNSYRLSCSRWEKQKSLYKVDIFQHSDTIIWRFGEKEKRICHLK